MSATPDVAQLLATAEGIANNPDAETSEIEETVIETVSAFEARMQHHFARGPFFVKLAQRLKAEGHAELARRVQQYYLATNVLKHGGGKSYRELVKNADHPFTLQDEDGKALIDVTANGFLTDLVETLRHAHAILETPS
tara:strand:- start:7939 stop:8355 length:417 start_codon:yes stop_codon:yes gene_type:complete